MRLHPRNIKKDDTFYECYSGKNVFVLCLTQPVQYPENSGKWRWWGQEIETQKNIEYLYDDAYTQYAPRLHDSPQYA